MRATAQINAKIAMSLQYFQVEAFVVGWGWGSSSFLMGSISTLRK